VVWATYPDVNVHEVPGATGSLPFPENDPKRVKRLNALIEAAVRSDPNASVVDFAAFAKSHDGDPNFRPDGVHLDGTSTRTVASWLGPQLTAGS
jgi:hypothetical protein